MSSNVRKYWQKHPVQLRVVAALILIFMPVFFPLFSAVAYFDVIVREFAGAYREYWRVLIKGRDA